jgi:predicted nucleic acid-binding protein
VNAVADSSPLIILAKLGCFELLGRIFTRVYISPEVYQEVVVSGAGRRGALEVESADWIETTALKIMQDLWQPKKSLCWVPVS